MAVFACTNSSIQTLVIQSQQSIETHPLAFYFSKNLLSLVVVVVLSEVPLHP